MSNWFESNPTKSVIAHTVVVAATVWAISTFVLNDNKLNLYKAQVDSANAVVKTLEAKISVLEDASAKCLTDNTRLLSWLESDPKTFPALHSKIAELEKKLSDRVVVATATPATDMAKTQAPYRASGSFKKGGSFTDELTGAVIGVSNIKTDYSATAQVEVPGKDAMFIENARAGTTWSFEFNGRKFRLTLASANFISDEITVSVAEIINHN